MRGINAIHVLVSNSVESLELNKIQQREDVKNIFTNARFLFLRLISGIPGYRAVIWGVINGSYGDSRRSSPPGELPLDASHFRWAIPIQNKFGKPCYSLQFSVQEKYLVIGRKLNFFSNKHRGNMCLHSIANSISINKVYNSSSICVHPINVFLTCVTTSNIKPGRRVLKIHGLCKRHKRVRFTCSFHNCTIDNRITSMVLVWRNGRKGAQYEIERQTSEL